MYTIIYIILLLLALYLIYQGARKKQNSLKLSGLGIGLITILFFWFMGFWGEKLWFDQLGYSQRFWTVWTTKIGIFAVSAAAGALIVFLITTGIPRQHRIFRQFAVIAGALAGGLFWYSQWDVFLRFTHRISTETIEPVLEHQTGFYLFTYPFLSSVYTYLLFMTVIGLAAAGMTYLYIKRKNRQADEASLPINTLFIAAGSVLITLAYGRYVARYGLLFSDFGIVSGPGWTDVHIRLPMLIILAGFLAIAGLGLIIAGMSYGSQKMWGITDRRLNLATLYAVSGTAVGLWILVLGVVPMLFQWLKVEPNEITVEKPYIENNIRFTRLGFHLDKVEEREYPVTETLNREIVDQNKNLFSNIRLWDYRALDAVFKQFQEIRLYYEFNDVDIDRYNIDGAYREVMVSAREMQPENLPANSQTFVNKRFKYTHGYGAALNLVNEFTSDGLPRLLIKDIPPVSNYDNLEIKRPEVYYGELSSHYVVVNSKEKEFDYPSGEKNIYAHYQGQGGVPISNVWRKVLYGWKYGGTTFLLSGYPSRESRIMMHRHIAERANMLAPFLYFDDDPYLVISEGKMYWFIDAYTTSSYYPYSESFSSFERFNYVQSERPESLFNLTGSQLRGNNYIRNSVKIVVDAYSGDVDLYVFEPEDPIVKVYDRIFPGLLKKKSEMPGSLLKHIRYPSDMLLVQGLVYGKYHMTDPMVFYNQEDLWIRSTEKYYNSVQPVEPYYVMWQPPESDEVEFVLILPFTPKDKQVMIGWIAGMCDGDDYGRFLAYKFPKEKRILGTQQVETKIDQDSYLSGQLTLWDQRGSNVIRGNVLAIPINTTMLYVEPIYLKSETSAYPELRLVALMHNDKLAYAETFDQALENLFAEAASENKVESVLTGTESVRNLIDRANNAFEDYLDLMQQKDFEKAGTALQQLEETLNKLADMEKGS